MDPVAAYAAILVREARFYLVGGAVAFVGFAALVLLGPSWPAAALLAGGLSVAGVGAWLARRRAQTVRIRIEDPHLHPIPVLDAPKGTYDLVAGMAVEIDNRRDEPIGARIDTLLYRRTALQWDQPLSEAEPVELLAPSVIPARSAKSFLVRNTTRIPAAVDVLTPSHFVKLLVETSDYGKSVDRVFLAERYELPKEPPKPAPSAAAMGDRAPLLPFSERLDAAPPRAPQRSAVARLGDLVRRLRPRGGAADGEVKIHRLRKSDDTLEGLIDEIEAELEDELGTGGR